MARARVVCFRVEEDIWDRFKRLAYSYGLRPSQLVSTRYSIGVVEDAHWGFVYVITLEASAREALEVNLELQRRFPGIPIVVRWTGGVDLPDEELADYVVKIARAGGFKARAPRGFSGVEAVREVREE